MSESTLWDPNQFGTYQDYDMILKISFCRLVSVKFIRHREMTVYADLNYSLDNPQSVVWFYFVFSGSLLSPQSAEECFVNGKKEITISSDHRLIIRKNEYFFLPDDRPQELGTNVYSIAHPSRAAKLSKNDLVNLRRYAQLFIRATPFVEKDART